MTDKGSIRSLHLVLDGGSQLCQERLPLPFIGQFIVRMFLICPKDYASGVAPSVRLKCTPTTMFVQQMRTPE